jgi:ABC-type amino acid transport substrate-binding protein
LKSVKNGFFFWILIATVLAGCSSVISGSVSDPAEFTTTDESVLSDSEDNEMILIGINTKNSPWAYIQNDTLQGFEIDVLNEIEKITGAKFIYYPALEGTIIDGLLQDQWDIAASSLLDNGGYEQGISFTDPYYLSGLSLMVKEDSNINSFEYMEDGKFGAVSGSDGMAWLESHLEMYGEYEIVEYDSAALAIRDLVDLNLSGVVAETSTLSYYAVRNPGVRLSAQMEETTPMAFAYRRGDLMGSRFDSAMQLLISNGTLSAIQEKWFGNSLVAENPLNLVARDSFGYPDSYTLPPVIRVGIQTHNPPWEMIEDSHMVGFEVDILNEAAERKGVSIEYMPANEKTIFSGLLANQWDVSASAISITRNNNEVVDFTGPYFDQSLALLTLADSSVSEIEHLGGGHYGVLDGSVAETWLKDHLDEFGPYVVDEYADIDTAIYDMETEIISGVIFDAYYLLHYANENEAVEVPLVFGETTPVAFATRPSDYLCDVLNETINDMKEDGTLIEIYRDWFGETILPESSTNTIYTDAYVP